MATSSKFLVAGIVVEATKSEGGGFYDVTVLLTGAKYRFLSDVFESVAKPYKDGDNENPSTQS